MHDLVMGYISAGGDLAAGFIAYAIWRLDRRVLKLELKHDT